MKKILSSLAVALVVAIFSCSNGTGDCPKCDAKKKEIDKKVDAYRRQLILEDTSNFK